MAAVALLRFTQGSTIGTNGHALKGVVGMPVSVENSDNTDIASWQIDLVYTDPASSVVPATPYAFSDNGSIPLAVFNPDVRGCYRFVLKVWNVPNREGTPTDVDIRVFCVPEESGLVVPPVQIWPRPLPPPASGLPGNKPNELNFLGHPDGWAGNGEDDGLLNDLIRRVDASLARTARQEQIEVESNGQTVFTLSEETTSNTTVEMYVNGVKLTYGTEYTVEGATVTYTGSPTLQTTDVVEFWYIIGALVGNDGGDFAPLSNVFYVDSGTDVPEIDQTGSQSAPFSTITSAMAVAASIPFPGPTLRVCPGDYSGEDPIVWAPAGYTPPILTVASLADGMYGDVGPAVFLPSFVMSSNATVRFVGVDVNVDADSNLCLIVARGSQISLTNGSASILDYLNCTAPSTECSSLTGKGLKIGNSLTCEGGEIVLTDTAFNGGTVSFTGSPGTLKVDAYTYETLVQTNVTLSNVASLEIFGNKPLTDVFFLDNGTSTPPEAQNGSRETPFSTLAAAIAAAPLDSVLLFAPGDYSAGLQDIDANVTLQSIKDTIYANGTTGSAVELEALNVAADVSLHLHSVEVSTGITLGANSIVSARYSNLAPISGDASSNVILEGCFIAEVTNSSQTVLDRCSVGGPVTGSTISANETRFGLGANLTGAVTLTRCQFNASVSITGNVVTDRYSWQQALGAGVTISGSVTFSDDFPVLAGGNSGAAKTIEWKSGLAQAYTLNDNTAFTFTAFPGYVGLVYLRLTQDETGDRVPTYSPNVLFSGGTPPTLSTTGGAIDLLVFFSDGTNFTLVSSALDVSDGGP